MPRTHGACAAAAAGQLVPEDLGKSHERELACAVRRVRWAPEQTKLRRDERDPSQTTVAHPGEHSLRQPHRSPHVHPVAVLEVLNGHVFDKVTPQDAGVADQHVDGTKRGLNLIPRAHTLLPLRYIRRHRMAWTLQLSPHRR